MWVRECVCVYVACVTEKVRYVVKGEFCFVVKLRAGSVNSEAGPVKNYGHSLKVLAFFLTRKKRGWTRF